MERPPRFGTLSPAPLTAGLGARGPCLGEACRRPPSALGLDQVLRQLFSLTGVKGRQCAGAARASWGAGQVRGGVRGALGGRLSAQLAAASKELLVSEEPAANEHLAFKNHLEARVRVFFQSTKREP